MKSLCAINMYEHLIEITKSTSIDLFVLKLVPTTSISKCTRLHVSNLSCVTNVSNKFVWFNSTCHMLFAIGLIYLGDNYHLATCSMDKYLHISAYKLYNWIHIHCFSCLLVKFVRETQCLCADNLWQWHIIPNRLWWLKVLRHTNWFCYFVTDK